MKNYWVLTGSSLKIMEYFTENHSNEYKKIFQNFMNGQITLEKDILDLNCTRELLNENPQLFLLQTGYLTFHEDYFENNMLKFPNIEVERSFTKMIFKSLQIKLAFQQVEFERFLQNLMDIYFNLIENKEKEENKMILEQFKYDLKKFLLIFMTKPLEAREQFTSEFLGEMEINFTTALNQFFVALLPFQKWTYRYQQTIQKPASKGGKGHEPNFWFTKGNHDIFVEFLKRGNDFWGHVEILYHLKTKSMTQKVVESHIEYEMVTAEDGKKKIPQLYRVGIFCFRREGNLMKQTGTLIINCKEQK